MGKTGRKNNSVNFGSCTGVFPQGDTAFLSFKGFQKLTEGLLVSLFMTQVRLFFFFKILFLLDRGEGREKEGEKHQCVVASPTPPTGALACNPGTCPDWESNQRAFGSQVGAQSTGPHQPGQARCLFIRPADLFIQSK